jgi:hypothetical protein
MHPPSLPSWPPATGFRKAPMIEVVDDAEADCNVKDQALSGG